MDFGCGVFSCIVLFHCRVVVLWVKDAAPPVVTHRVCFFFSPQRGHSNFLWKQCFPTGLILWCAHTHFLPTALAILHNQPIKAMLMISVASQSRRGWFRGEKPSLTSSFQEAELLVVMTAALINVWYFRVVNTKVWCLLPKDNRPWIDTAARFGPDSDQTRVCLTHCILG